MTSRFFFALLFLLILSAVLLATPFAAWADTGERLILGAMGTEAAVTEVLRAQGHSEANVLQQNRAAGYAIKGAVCGSAIAYRRHLIRTGHKGWAKVLTAGVVGISLAAVGVSLYRAR